MAIEIKKNALKAKDSDGNWSDVGAVASNDTYALRSKYSDTSISVGRKANTVIGEGSAAIGTDVVAPHDNEASFGKYNESNDNTLFSVGDGTADDARHNAFEITTTGGKLHDKDIVTADMSLPANGGNADKANVIADYENPDRITKIGWTGESLTPSQVHSFSVFTDLSPSEAKIKDISIENVKKVLGLQSDVDLSDVNDAPYGVSYAPMTGCANAPFDFWTTILTLGGTANTNYKQQIAFPWGTENSKIMPKYRVMDSGVWKDWRTCGDIKPYITGDATVAANSSVCASEHGFIPSAVFWWENNGAVYSATSFDTTSFNMAIAASGDRIINYIIFK